MSIDLKITADTSSAVKGINTVGKKVTELGIKAKNASSKGLNVLNNGLGSVSNKVNGMFPKLGKLAGALGPVAGGFIAVGAAVVGTTLAMKGLADQTAEMADNIGKASQRMDVSIEFYQRMSSAAGHAGTSIGTMESAMRKMLLKMTQVEQGNKLATKAFEDLGVSVFDSEGNMRNQEQVFKDVLISLSKMTNHTERNAKAQEVLGRSASQLAPFFNEGTEAVNNYITANDSAVIVSKELAESSALYNDTIQTMGEELNKAKNTGLEPFMEGMAGLATTMSENFQWKLFLGNLEKTITLAGEVALALDWMNGGEERAAEENKAQDEKVELIKREVTRLKDAREAREAYNKSIDEGLVSLTDNRPKKFQQDLNETYGEAITRLDKYISSLERSLGINQKAVTVLTELEKQTALANAELARQSRVAHNLEINLKAYDDQVRAVSTSLGILSDAGQVILDVQFATMSKGLNKQLSTVNREFDTHRDKLQSSLSDLTLPAGLSDEQVTEILNRADQLTAELLALEIKRNDKLDDVRQKSSARGTNLFDISMINMMEDGAERSTKIVEQTVRDQKAIWLESLNTGFLTQQQHDELLKEQERSTQQQLKDIRQKGIEDSISSITTVGQKALEITGIFASGLSSMQDQRKRTSDSIFAKEDSDRTKEINSMKISNARKQKLLDEQQKEINKRKNDEFEKAKAGRIAQVAMDTAGAIMGAWTSVASIPFPGNVIAGGSLSAALTGFGIAQSSSISKEQSPYFRDGGVVGGFGGATNGPDNVTANVRNGEMILNAEQQRNLFNTIDSGESVSAGSISISIENFTGGDDELEKLENMLLNLQSSGRFTFA
jgi:hypothetical protein